MRFKYQTENTEQLEPQSRKVSVSNGTHQQEDVHVYVYVYDMHM